MRVVSNEQMKQIEMNANSLGMSYSDMMENAGNAIADFIHKNTKDFENSIILFLVGNGNNGGDGYVAARRIRELGGNPLIIMVDGMPKTPNSKENFDKANDLGIEILSYEPSKSMALLFGSEVIVDCIYGTGFHGNLSDDIIKLNDIVSDCDGKKFAVDIPSGINGDGAVSSGAFKADFTIAIDSLKNAHISAFDYCGRVVCVDIGIPDECHSI